jgi:hypothetical protein
MGYPIAELAEVFASSVQAFGDGGNMQLKIVANI